MIDQIFNPLNSIFFSLIGALFLVDFVTHYRGGGRSHTVLRHEVLGLGILGTFVGIFVALLNFDQADISGSIPGLLGGMKTAFVTSVVGMSASLILTVSQTLRPSLHAKTGNPVDDKLTEQTQRFSEIFERIISTNESVEEQIRLLFAGRGDTRGALSESAPASLRLEG